MDPDETAPIGAVGSESTLFVGKASKTFQQTTKTVELVVIGALRVNRAKQLNRRRQRRPALYGLVCPINVHRKLKSYFFTDTLVYTFAHWSGPPRTYADFSKDQQRC